MKQQDSTLDKSKYQKIKTGFVVLLQEARKQEPELGEEIVASIFKTLSNIDCFLDETSATGHFLEQSMNGRSRTLKHTTIRKLSESFRAYAALNKADRTAVADQLRLSIEVEQLKMARAVPIDPS